MNGKVLLILLFALVWAPAAFCQRLVKDSVKKEEEFGEEEFGELFNELDLLLDSLTAPRSFLVLNLGVRSNYFSYHSRAGYELRTRQQLAYTPSLSYFSKTGLGISGSAVVLHDGERLNPFQFYMSGSYDYLKKSAYLAGVAYTRFFARDSLPFYTSPLRNEAYAYFTYRKLWFKPGIALSYGWGSTTAYAEKEAYVQALRLRRRGFTRVRTRESVNDFNLITSVRHDFYWGGVWRRSDYVRLTPQFVFTSGTQRFGFNQTSSSYVALPRTGTNVLYNSKQVTLDEVTRFQPLSLSAYVKTEYSVGKFFIQPQLILDYYFPTTGKNLSTAFAVNAGVIF